MGKNMRRDVKNGDFKFHDPAWSNVSESAKHLQRTEGAPAEDRKGKPI